MPVTARQLETLIRVSTAIAKSHLAKVVELADAKKAYELLYFACFKVLFLLQKIIRFVIQLQVFRKNQKSDLNLKSKNGTSESTTRIQMMFRMKKWKRLLSHFEF